MVAQGCDDDGAVGPDELLLAGRGGRVQSVPGDLGAGVRGRVSGGGERAWPPLTHWIGAGRPWAPCGGVDGQGALGSRDFLTVPAPVSWTAMAMRPDPRRSVPTDPAGVVRIQLS